MKSGHMAVFLSSYDTIHGVCKLNKIKHLQFTWRLGHRELMIVPPRLKFLGM